MPGFCPDFDQIFGQVFDQIFGQGFDQGLGEGKNHEKHRKSKKNKGLTFLVLIFLIVFLQYQKPTQNHRPGSLPVASTCVIILPKNNPEKVLQKREIRKFSTKKVSPLFDRISLAFPYMFL